MRPTVVVTHRVHPEILELLETACQVIANQSRTTLPRTEILQRCREAQGLMAFMPDCIDADFLQQCPQLKVIGAALKGYDNFAVEACTTSGVWLTIVPDLLTAPTAELAIALLLGLIRKLRDADAYVRLGNFQGWLPIFYGAGLAGRQIGLLGMGAIGKAIARRLAGFDAKLNYFDQVQLEGREEQRLDLHYQSFDDLLSTNDYLLCSVPLTTATRQLIGEQTLQKIKPGAFLVNIGRGSVVDECAVATALTDDRLAGYAADVFSFEDWALTERPVAIPPELLSHPERTLLTPHLGSAVAAVRRDIELCAAQNILTALRNETPMHAINQPHQRKP